MKFAIAMTFHGQVHGIGANSHYGLHMRDRKVD